MSALLSSQQISAAAEAEVLFEESFAADEGSFTAEGVDIWYWAAGEHSMENGIRMKADRNDASAGTYFVSPEITLGTANTLRFRHCIENCWLNDFQARAGVFVRTKGGNWVEIPVFNYTDNFREPVNSDDLKVPAEFNGKKVVIK